MSTTELYSAMHDTPNHIFSKILNSTIQSSVLSIYQNLKNKYPSTSRNFAILKICIENESLNEEYTNRVLSHNKSLITNMFADSGFDLIVPEQTIFSTDIESKFIDMMVKGEMVYCDVANDMLSNCAFTMHPRSSMSKTPLMLANHTGIIDAGYRGSIIGAFRWLRSHTLNLPNYVVEKYTRLVQLCHPTLCPIFVVIVEPNDLTNTVRGSNGFGSTGV